MTLGRMASQAIDRSVRCRATRETSLATIVALALASSAWPADIIPADRRMAWEPGVTTGVVGGIPRRDRIFVDVGATTDSAYRCLGDGTTDDGVALRRALADCPAGQVVYVPAGTYRLASELTIAKHGDVTLRGAGPGRTVFTTTVAGAHAGTISIGDGDWPPPSERTAITGGATIGSTTLSVADASAIGVGALLRIEPRNPPWVHNLNGQGDAPTMTFQVKAVAVTATTVTFTPPLPIDLSGLAPSLVVYRHRLIEGVGLEDFSLDCSGSTCPQGIKVEQAWGCWIANVEVQKAVRSPIFLCAVSASEIRHCFIHDARGGGPEHEGIDLFQDCCWNLIEDNICVAGGFPNIVLGDWHGGCQGNVIAFNRCSAVDSGDPTNMGCDISFSHGPHNVLNLAEGNVVGMIQSDGYWGSASHGTIFRNWITVDHPTATVGRRGIDLCHFSTFFSIVGNVIGTERFPAAPDGRYDTELDDYPYFGASPWSLIYRLGYPNMGNPSYDGAIAARTPPDYSDQSFELAKTQSLDGNVLATLLRHGNYDFATRTVVWDPSIAEREIPASLFRTSKPAWFGDLAWPAIDPARPPRALDAATLGSTIPAAHRFIHGRDPVIVQP